MNWKSMPRLFAALSILWVVLLFLAAAGLPTAAVAQWDGDSDPWYSDSDGYGRTRGGDWGFANIDGISGFVHLMKERGMDVRHAQRITPSIDRYHTILWCPNRNDPPSDAACRRLQKWLAQDSSRRLIYVAGGYRGRMTLMQKQLELAKKQSEAKSGAGAEGGNEIAEADQADQKNQADRQEQSGHYERMLRRMNEVMVNEGINDGAWFGDTPSFLNIQYYDEGTCPWYSQTAISDTPVKRFSGPWSDRFRGGKAQWNSGHLKIDPAETVSVESFDEDFYTPDLGTETLLRGDGKVLMFRIYNSEYEDYSGQAYVLANGSAILNLGLTNRENVRFANSLIDECQGDVLVLQSGPQPIEVRNHNSPENSGFEWLQRQPLNTIVPMFLLLSIVAFFVVFPIHGRPRRINLEPPRTFAGHIEATASLLRGGRNRRWAVDLLTRRQEKDSHRAAAAPSPPAIEPPMENSRSIPPTGM